MKRDYCSDCGTTYDTRGLCACTEPDWLRAEVQRLQEQVSRLLDARTIDRLQAHGDGYQDGHRAGQEAMRERCASHVADNADGACNCGGTILCRPDCARVRLLDQVVAIRALEVE